MARDPTHKAIIGIVGGMGSGKSAVAAEFSKLGCAVIDADALAHKFLDEVSVQQQVAEALGMPPFNKSKPLSREKIAHLAFNSPDRLAKLTNILHPRILERSEQLISAYSQIGEIPAIILDMPLLLEVGWAPRCDRIIFIKCPKKLRYQRIQAKRKISLRDIKMRENFQISLDKKRIQADTTINNNSDYSALVRQVNEIFSEIVNSC